MYRKIIAVFICTVLTLFVPIKGAEAKEPELSAKSAILVCADSGEILYEKNADSRLAIASITKIMTAVIALEYAEKDNKVISFTSDMTAEGSSMYLEVGDRLRITELVKGLMCVSGNDAANAIAEGVAGSRKGFAVLMNKKAAELGMYNTHFVTPSGLDDENHYSSARDMAALCRYAMENESFVKIVSQRECRVDYVYPEGKYRVCVNHNKLLSACDGCIGIKTGYTKKAGRTLTSCVEREGMRLIAVTLNDRNDWEDHESLYEYGFSMVYSKTLACKDTELAIPVVGGQRDIARVRTSSACTAMMVKGRGNDVTCRVLMPNFIYAPVIKGKSVGRLCFYSGERLIASSELAAAEEIEYDE